MFSLKPAKWHPLVSFTPPHTIQLNPWPNSSAKLISQLCGELQPAVCLSRDVEPFEGDPSTHGYLTSLRNKPQQKEPGQLSASTLA